jgi:hypothetical protein
MFLQLISRDQISDSSVLDHIEAGKSGVEARLHFIREGFHGGFELDVIDDF